MYLKITAKTILALLGIFVVAPTQADELYDPVAAKICSSQTSNTRSEACMKLIKGKQFSPQASRFCSGLKYWNKQEQCLETIANKHYDVRAFNICTEGSLFGEKQKSCLNDIGDKEFVSSVEVDMCRKKSSSTRRMNCLKKATTKKYEPPADEKESTEQLARSEIKNRIREAYRLLRADKNTDATLILHDLLAILDKEETSE